MKLYHTFLLLLLTAIFIASGYTEAQIITSGSYPMTTATNVYGGDLGLSYTTVIFQNSDNVSSGVISLPFTFTFAGQTYTQFSVTDNGLISLGNSGDPALTGNETSNLMASSTPGLKIAPYWDDLTTGTNGYVKWAFNGSSLFINWRVKVPKNPLGAVNAEFQVRLSSGGTIGFYYGSTAFTTIPANAGQYSIGIGNSSTDFASVTLTGANTATAAYGIANDANALGITGPFDIYFNPDLTAPTISAETIGNISGTGNRTLTKTIADAGSHVPENGGLVPRIYYKKLTDVSWVSTAGVLQTGNGTSGTWLFTVDHSLLTGVSGGDVIQYYVIAQDQSLVSGHYNINSNPTGVVATDVNTITTPPASPASYIIPRDFSGTVTVGTGGDYPSLTNPGGLFEQLNAGTITGNVTVNIISDLTSETGAVYIKQWTEGPGGPFTVTVNPVGIRTISGTGGTSGLIYLNGAKRFVIDGLNSAGNSLTILNLNTNYLTINFTGGASYNTITNTTIKGSALYASVINFGAPITGAGNNHNTISNNIITSQGASIGYGINCNGNSTAISYDNVFDNNKISNIYYTGINLGYYYARVSISNNEIYNSTPTGQNLNGIYISNYYGGGTYNIFNNYIHDLNPALSTGTWTVCGLNYNQGSYNPPYDTLNIYNNIISLDAVVNNTNLSALNGMWLNGGGSSYLGRVNIYYNSIYIGGTGILAGTSTGIKLGGGSWYSRNTVKNNVIYSARSGGTGKHYGLYYAYNTNLVSDNNDVYVIGTNSFFGYYLADRATLANWRTALGQDLASYSGDPGFADVYTLQPDPNNMYSNYLNGHGVPISTISTDILGNARSTTPGTPTDIGAYEFTPTPVISYTISGTTGLAGTVLTWNDGGPQTTTADGSGNYSVTVTFGWSGTLTPSFTGYTFSPASATFNNVLANQVQDFTAIPIVYTISGNAGYPNALMSWNDGGAKTTTADGTGAYSFTVSYNWSGTVTPSFTGITFTPANKVYTNVLANQPNQNYTSAPTVYTISGNTTEANTVLTWRDGVMKTTITDGSGNYSITVSYSWTGVITPFLPGFTFSPSFKKYQNVLNDMPNQNYTTILSSFIILGNTGAGNTTLSWFDVTAKTKTSTSLGDYYIIVPYGWSGDVTPTLAGYTFTPAFITYTDISSNFVNQNYTAAPVTFTISGNTGIGGVTLSWDDAAFAPLKSSPEKMSNDIKDIMRKMHEIDSTLAAEKNMNKKASMDKGVKGDVTPSAPGPMVPKTLVSNPDGSYSFQVSYNWSGTVTPSYPGYTFTPANHTYTNVLANMTGQDFTAAPTLVTYTISGNAGIANAILRWFDGTPKATIADGTGAYSITVPSSWSGTVTPSFNGYTFSPWSKTYTNVVSDLTNQDYSAFPLPSNLVGYWPLNETTSGVYTDHNRSK